MIKKKILIVTRVKDMLHRGKQFKMIAEISQIHKMTQRFFLPQLPLNYLL